MAGNVFIAFQANDDTRPIVDAIEKDNPDVDIQYLPAMVKINSNKPLVINRESVEENIGRSWDIQEIHINLISISGYIDETEDCFTIAWKN